MNINLHNLSSNKLYTITLTAPEIPEARASRRLDEALPITSPLPIYKAEFIYKTDAAIFTYIMEDEFLIINNNELDLTEFNDYMIRVKRDHNMNEIIYDIIIYSNDINIVVNINPEEPEAKENFSSPFPL